MTANGTGNRWAGLLQSSRPAERAESKPSSALALLERVRFCCRGTDQLDAAELARFEAACSAWALGRSFEESLAGKPRRGGRHETAREVRIAELRNMAIAEILVASTGDENDQARRVLAVINGKVTPGEEAARLLEELGRLGHRWPTSRSRLIELVSAKS